jgi:hypothetical protein
MNKRQDFLDLAAKVERGIEEEMAHRTLGDDVAPRQQLEFMLREVRRVAMEIRDGLQPVGTHMHLQSASLVVDSWPWEHPLGRLIADLSNMYHELAIAD